MTTSLMIHNVTSIKVSKTESLYAKFGGAYVRRNIEITDSDGHTFQITVFGKCVADLAFEMPQPVALATTAPEAA